MKGVIILVIAGLLIFAGWSYSNCNNKIPSIQKYIEPYTRCMCPNNMEKIQGSDGMMCVNPHQDSMNPCKADDHCTKPEQCVRFNQTDFTCKYVQGGCYQYMDFDGTVKENCI